MGSLSWFLVSTIAAGAGLMLLHAVAVAVRRESGLHDLKVHVAKLRISYLEGANKVEYGEPVEKNDATLPADVAS